MVKVTLIQITCSTFVRQYPNLPILALGNMTGEGLQIHIHTHTHTHTHTLIYNIYIYIYIYIHIYLYIYMYIYINIIYIYLTKIILQLASSKCDIIISALHKHHAHETWLSGLFRLLSEQYLRLMPDIEICSIQKTQFGSQVLTQYFIRASSSIPFKKPFFKTLGHSTNVFLPFSVLVIFLLPLLSYTFWHRIHFISCNLHSFVSFGWTSPSDPKLALLFVYQFSFISSCINQRIIINIKTKVKLVQQVQPCQYETWVSRAM